MQYFIIDALNLAYRAHNANFKLKTSTGLFSGMLFGFVRTVLSLKKKYRGYKFIVVWDSKPIAKYALQPDYKAGRASLAPTVMSQIDDIKDFLYNAGVDQYCKYGEEADDVIATLVDRLKDEGAVVVYSNDKDMLQLVENGKVIVYKPKVGVSPEKFYDEEAVKNQFGVSPKKLSLFRSFDGDNSDNITGVERVPRKLIARVVNASDSVDSFYTELEKEKLTDFQKRSFAEGKERVETNLKIVALKKDLQDITHQISQIDKNKITELFKKFEIKSINSDVVADIFSSVLNIRYTEARPSFKVESYSLF